MKTNSEKVKERATQARHSKKRASQASNKTCHTSHTDGHMRTRTLHRGLTHTHTDNALCDIRTPYTGWCLGQTSAEKRKEGGEGERGGGVQCRSAWWVGPGRWGAERGVQTGKADPSLFLSPPRPPHCPPSFVPYMHICNLFSPCIALSFSLCTFISNSYLKKKPQIIHTAHLSIIALTIIHIITMLIATMLSP